MIFLQPFENNDTGFISAVVWVTKKIWNPDVRCISNDIGFLCLHALFDIDSLTIICYFNVFVSYTCLFFSLIGFLLVKPKGLYFFLTLFNGVVLWHFQSEIGSISSDIKILQEKSMDMGLKLKNRKVSLFLSEAMLHCLVGV